LKFQSWQPSHLFHQVVYEAKRRKVAASPYISADWVPVTSVLAESFFSSASAVWSESRSSITPYNLECTMFLKFNRFLWNASTVQQVIQGQGNNDDESDNEIEMQ
jgi:hypothetical protein